MGQLPPSDRARVREIRTHIGHVNPRIRVRVSAGERACLSTARGASAAPADDDLRAHWIEFCAANGHGKLKRYQLRGSSVKTAAQTGTGVTLTS